MNENKKGTALKATIVVCLSLLFVLSLAEVAIRIVEKSGAYPEVFKLIGNASPPLNRRDGPGMYYAHQYSAYALKPGYSVGDRERINSLGFRGEEIALEKPEGVFRIVAIGGSTTFAVYLPWHQSFPYYLQKELRSRFNTDRIEVINAGLTGSTAAESFHRMATQVLPVDPDMVIIYHGFNDLLPRVFDDYQEDYYHFRKSDPNNPPGMSRFYIYRLALRVLSPGLFHENNNLMRHVWKTQNLPDTDTERARNFLASSSDAFRENMEDMVALLKGRGVKVVLASFAILPDTWHWMDAIPPYLWELGIKENNEVVAELASKYDVPEVPFAEAPFKDGAAYYKTKMFDDSIHMSPAGNQFKAAIFADTVAPIMAKALGVKVPAMSAFHSIDGAKSVDRATETATDNDL